MQRSFVTSIFISGFVFASGLWAAPVNINQASAEQISTALKGKGIGPMKAQAIVEYRNANGPFKSMQDLDKVHGIGPKILSEIEADIRFDNQSTAAAAPTTKIDTVVPGTPAKNPSTAAPTAPAKPVATGSVKP